MRIVVKVYLFAAALLTASSACTTLSPTLKPTISAIKIETWVWGTKAESWLVETNGKVTIEVVDRLHVHPLTYTKTAFTVSTSDVAAFAARLQPARNLLPTGIPCDGPLATDQGSTTIEWMQQSGATTLRFDYGCRSSEMTIVETALDDATVFLKAKNPPGP